LVLQCSSPPTARSPLSRSFFAFGRLFSQAHVFLGCSRALFFGLFQSDTRFVFLIGFHLRCFVFFPFLLPRVLQRLHPCGSRSTRSRGFFPAPHLTFMYPQSPTPSLCRKFASSLVPPGDSSTPANSAVCHLASPPFRVAVYTCALFEVRWGISTALCFV